MNTEQKSTFRTVGQRLTGIDDNTNVETPQGMAKKSASDMIDVLVANKLERETIKGPGKLSWYENVFHTAAVNSVLAGLAATLNALNNKE